MSDLRTLLQDADPVAREPGLSAADASAMRRAILESSRNEFLAAPGWIPALAIVTVVACAVAAGIVTGRRLPVEPVAPVADAELPAANRTRQLQFSTPGGTRIIWVFDQSFPLEETMP